MAGDLDVSTATWGTAGLLLASGDAIDGTTGAGWCSQVAQNTGWLYYRPRMLYAAHIAANGAPGTTTGAAYVAIGTYSIYGRAKHSGYGSVTLRWDGTAVVTAEDETDTGSICGWATDTARWVTIALYAEDLGEGESASGQGQISMRFGSWAP